MKHYIPVCVMFCALLAFASCAKDNTQPTSNNTTTQSANNGGNSSGNNGGGTQTASIVGTQWQANNNGDVYILHFIDGNTVMMRMGSNAEAHADRIAYRSEACMASAEYKS